MIWKNLLVWASFWLVFPDSAWGGERVLKDISSWWPFPWLCCGLARGLLMCYHSQPAHVIAHTSKLQEGMNIFPAVFPVLSLCHAVHLSQQSLCIEVKSLVWCLTCLFTVTRENLLLFFGSYINVIAKRMRAPRSVIAYSFVYCGGFFCLRFWWFGWDNRFANRHCKMHLRTYRAETEFAWGCYLCFCHWYIVCVCCTTHIGRL